MRFARAVAEAPWTLPSHVTMLSGLHPLTHGVRRPNEGPADEVVPLAQLLADTHYGFAVTDGGWLSAEWGFGRGFQSFHAGDQDIERAVEQTLEYVRHRRERGPWFGFLHTYDLHCPYDPPAPWAGSLASAEAEPIEVAGRCGNPDFNALALTPGQARFLSDRYDEDLRRIDDALGRLFQAFDELDLWRDTVVIVTSDHGEEFLEHGRIGHERTVSSEVLSIPLLIHAPGIAPGVDPDVVGLADLVPTVLELTRSAPPARCDGRSLVPRLRGEGRSDESTVLSELAWQEDRMVRTSAEGRLELDLADHTVDPAVHAEFAGVRARMRAAGFEPRPVDGLENAAELRRLGY